MNQPVKQVDFPRLVSVIKPILDKDRAMQLQGLYVRLRSNNINKEEFVKQMRSLVGDHLLKMAVSQLNANPSSLQIDNYAHGVYKSSNVNGVKQGMNTPSSKFQQQHKCQLSAPQGLFLAHTESSKKETFEMMSSRLGFSASTNKPEPMSSITKFEGHFLSAGTSSLAFGTNPKTPPIKASVGQKKPLEEHISSLSKKQKVSGAYTDQSIKQLNDQPAVVKEEKKPILQKTPFQLIDEDDDDNDDRSVERSLLNPKQEQCEFSDMKKMHKQEPLDQMNEKQHKSQLSSPQIESSEEKTSEMMLSTPVLSRSMNKQEPMSTTKLERKNVLFDKDDDDHDNDDDDAADVELLDPKQEQCALVEYVPPVSDSTENLSSPKSGMICIQGYKVKQSNATILEAIFKKHGDIAAKCVFKTSSARAYFCWVNRVLFTGHDHTDHGS